MGLTVKGEAAALLDTLLDLQLSYPPPDPKPTPTTPTIPLEQKLRSLLPLLLASYGATLSSPDQSLLRVLLHINDIIFSTDEYQEKLQEKLLSARNSPADGQPSVGAAIPSGDRGQAIWDPNAVIPNDSRVADDSINATVGTGITPRGDARDATGDARGSDEMPRGPITALLQGPLAEAG